MYCGEALNCPPDKGVEEIAKCIAAIGGGGNVRSNPKNKTAGIDIYRRLLYKKTVVLPTEGAISSILPVAPPQAVVGQGLSS